ncbi:symmetrical bis(5'-nucleosyl)-tetraphosphatase [Gilvimarinus sp. F26214L]|uniref:symmetrical bis(5'-nucleosyl)-tetraphosphatase n=1 Tax=Gilvimarinus sp. DZF01 TaxID=3461371 RepID=UPI00404596CE
MSTYAVGDLQGCLDPLKCLLDQVNFDPVRDRLWLCGDLVNRGPASLETLRFLYGIRGSLVGVLGNHDLHLLALAWGTNAPRPKDTLAGILEAPDREELLNWLRHFKLVHHDASLGFAMVHAGIPPIWTLSEAVARSREVEAVLQGEQYRTYFANMYGNEPDCWSEDLKGPERWRVITNYFTRMRFCSAEGRLELKCKLGPDRAPEGFAPWFRHPSPALDESKLVFGHWASLEGKTDREGLYALDTGCVWGRQMTMLCLETGELLRCDC